MRKKISNIGEVSTFSTLADISEAVKGKYAKFESYDFNFVIIKSVAFVSVPTVTERKEINIELPAHYPFVAFVGSGSAVSTVSVGEDENLNTVLESGDSLFVFFNLKE